MRIHLFFLFLVSQLSSLAESGQIIDIKKDLSLGFSDHALEKIKIEYSKEGEDRSYKENLELLRLEALVRNEGGIEESVRFLENSERPEIIDELQYWKGVSEINNGEYGKALEILEPLLKKTAHPYRDSILTNICRLHLNLGNLETVSSYIESLKPNEIEAHAFLKAEILLELGRKEEAREILDLIPVEKFSIQRDLYMSWFYFQEGDLEKAISKLEGKDYPLYSRRGREAWSFLSSLYYEKGDLRALEVIKKVLLYATDDDPITTYFDQLLLSSQLESDAGDTVRFLEKLKEENDEELAPYILYFKAQLINNQEKRLKVLSRLYTEYGEHSLAEKASFNAASLALQLKDPVKKEKQLLDIIENAPDSAVKAKVCALLASEKEGEGKMYYYKKGLKYAEVSQIPTLRLNYNLSQSEQSESKRRDLILTSQDRSTLLLERALSVQHKDPERAKQWLEEFLTIHERHPRKAQAHLCLAELLLNDENEKIRKTAKAHLETIESQYKEELENVNRFTQAYLRLAIVESDKEKISELVKSPDFNVEGALELGVLLYQSGFALEASQVLRKLDSGDVASREKGLADIYIALSYFKLGTKAHEEDALSRLERIVNDKESALKTRARELLANHFYSKAELEKALEHIKLLPKNPDNRLLEAKTLAISSEKKDADKAAVIYRRLYQDSSLPASFRYNVAFQLALFQEENGKKSENLELFYQVANFEHLPEPTTDAAWSLYKRMGFKGIELLESSGNWMTAFKFAQLLSKSNSPDRERFSEKAKEISLQNILWDDGQF